MSYRLVILSTGYVESASISFVAFRYNFMNESYADAPELNTVRETLTNLANALFWHWWESDITEFMEGYQGDIVWEKVNFGYWEAYMRNLCRATTNDFGTTDPLGWWPWSSWNQIAEVPREETVAVLEKAETLIPLLVDFSTMDLHTDEQEEIRKLKELYTKWLCEEFYYVGYKTVDKIAEVVEDMLRECVENP